MQKIVDRATMRRVAEPGARFDRMTMTMHWGAFLCLLMVFASGWLHGAAEDAAQAAMLLGLHRTAGLALWLLTVARIVWRGMAAHTPPLPRGTPLAHWMAARAMQWLLYVALILQPVTGLLQTIARGKSFAVAGMAIPVLMPRDRELAQAVHELHEKGAWLLCILVAMHVGAALIHHFVMRDDVLRAMLPKWSKKNIGRSGIKEADLWSHSTIVEYGMKS